MMGVVVASSRRVLLVDDEPENLDVLAALLEDDFDVHLAHGGREALTVFSSVGDFAAVISDQRMPGMTGVELLSELRRRAPNTVRMVLTAYSDLPPIVAAVNEGSVYRLFLKPWSPDEMRAAIADAVWIYEAQGALNLLVDLLAVRQRELAATLAKLKRSQNELLASERMSTLGRFAAGITHNIRNSLTVMMHLVDTVQQKPTAEPRLLHSAQHAFQTLDALLHLANDVGALARGRLDTIKCSRVEMAPFLARTVNLFAQEALGRAHPVSITVAPSAHHLFFDHTRLEKALLALLRSTAHASPAHSRLALVVHPLLPHGETHVEVSRQADDAALLADPLDIVTVGLAPPGQVAANDGAGAEAASGQTGSPGGPFTGPPEAAELALGLEVSRVVAEAHGGRLLEVTYPDRGIALELWIANADPEGK